MIKSIIKEIQQRPLGHLTVVCTRSGNGLINFDIELANCLAMRGIPVCYCSITRTKKNLENKLLPGVHILSTFPQRMNYVLKRLAESARARGSLVLVDDFWPFALREEDKNTPARTYGKTKVEIELMQEMRVLAIQREMLIVITGDCDTDENLPISKEAIKLCDSVYILSKDNITALK